MDISFIGSGNVAHALSRLFHEAGHRILQVISPHEAHARRLAERYAARWSDHLDAVDRGADLVMLAVKDSAISSLNRMLRLNDQLVVHTAGGVPMAAISGISSRIGVFYPLQTLNRAADASRDFPVLLETNDPGSKDRLTDLANGVSGRVEWMSSEERLKMHVAGVFCNNFVHRLAALAENFCRNEALDFSLLHPLLEETTARMKAGKAEEWQTGPARRGDMETMALHEQVLQAYPDMRHIYRVFSEEIRKGYHKNK